MIAITYFPQMNQFSKTIFTKPNKNLKFSRRRKYPKNNKNKSI